MILARMKYWLYELRIPILALVLSGTVIIAVTGRWSWVSGHVFPNTTWGLYSKDFFENVLVEAHGMILDLLVIGLVAYLFQRRSERSDLKKQVLRDLEDLRHYRGSDAGYRIYGELRRLSSLGVKKVTIATARINDVSLEGLDLVDSSAQGVVISKSSLRDCAFTGCDFDGAVFLDVRAKRTTFRGAKLVRAKLVGARFKGCDFSGADLTGADFSNADLSSAIFRGANCTRTKFDGAKLRSANFVGATGLSEELSSIAADAKHIKMK
ncbi:TPA: pentapeptide repeat-containing protein [Stenotrophomonas maltophilia]|nr:pentapeptide repeat-containing protein [Stenotrophomonas maltophilia]